MALTPAARRAGMYTGEGGDEQHERGSRDVPAEVDCRRLVEQTLQQPGHRYCTAETDDGTQAGKAQPAGEEQCDNRPRRAPSTDRMPISRVHRAT